MTFGGVIAVVCYGLPSVALGGLLVRAMVEDRRHRREVAVCRQREQAALHQAQVEMAIWWGLVQESSLSDEELAAFERDLRGIKRLPSAREGL